MNIIQKFIRFIADISGVTKEIKKEEREEIANSIKDASYWFTNHKSYGYQTYPFIYWMAESIRNQYGCNGQTAREMFDNLKEGKFTHIGGHWIGFRYNKDTNTLTAVY